MFNSKTWFRELFNSPYYHKLYFEHLEKEAAAFIARLLNKLNPRECAKLLDVACGRSRHSKYYLTKWFNETHFYKKIEIEDEHLDAPLEYTEKVAKFSIGDFNDMFAYHHLQLKEIYGDYLLNGYDVRTSPRMIMIGEKIN